MIESNFEILHVQQNILLLILAVINCLAKYHMNVFKVMCDVVCYSLAKDYRRRPKYRKLLVSNHGN